MQRNVIFYAQELLPSSTAVAVRCSFLINSLLKHGANVTVYTNSDSKKAELQGVQYRRLFFKPTNKHGFVLRALLEVLAGFELGLRSLFFEKAENTILVFSAPPYLTVLIAGVMAKFFGFSYVLDVRDMYPEVYFQEKLIAQESLFGRLMVWFDGLLLKGADWISTVTHGFEEKISSRTGKPIVLVRNGFDADHFKLSDAPGEKFVCLFHGNLGRMQDLELIKKVASVVLQESQEIEFWVAGTGACESVLMKDKPENVKLLGAVAYSDVPALIQKTHLGLSFRKPGWMGEAAIPVKVFEYIGSGKPVIVTPHGEAGDIVRENQMGYVFSAGDVQEIARAILNLARDPALYTQLCANVVEHRSEFSRQRSAEIFAEKMMSP